MIFLHQHQQFKDLLSILGREKGIIPGLIEKDYWLMHALWGLQNNGFLFQLKGGTSLSKGYGIIDRFSEDIDILIEPKPEENVPFRKNHTKEKHKQRRLEFFDSLPSRIAIDGFPQINRDINFDSDNGMNAGIRLYYAPAHPLPEGVKDGILLEAGFDQTSPNSPVTISSWALGKAQTILRTGIIDNSAKNVACYDPGYTFVEKLQTISTKYRKFAPNGTAQPNFLRHYYDIYCLLANQRVQSFIGTPEYHQHKLKRFHKDDDLNIANNEAFLLPNPTLRRLMEESYLRTNALYYTGQVPFETIMTRIQQNAPHL